MVKFYRMKTSQTMDVKAFNLDSQLLWSVDLPQNVMKCDLSSNSRSYLIDLLEEI